VLKTDTALFGELFFAYQPGRSLRKEARESMENLGMPFPAGEGEV